MYNTISRVLSILMFATALGFAICILFYSAHIPNKNVPFFIGFAITSFVIAKYLQYDRD